MADKKEPVYQVKGAMGIYHSVPESKLEEFQRSQKQLEESGELEKRLQMLDQQLLESRAERRRKK